MADQTTPPRFASRRRLLGASLLLLGGCSIFQPTKPVAPARFKIGLALGGGAARGFAHIGVIKMLESHGIVPDYVVGTSAGAVVGSLYAAGYDAFAMQKIAQQLDEKIFADWTLGGRGLLKGEALQDFINQHLQVALGEILVRELGADRLAERLDIAWQNAIHRQGHLSPNTSQFMSSDSLSVLTS